MTAGPTRRQRYLLRHPRPDPLRADRLGEQLPRGFERLDGGQVQSRSQQRHGELARPRPKLEHGISRRQIEQLQHGALATGSP